MIWSIDHSFFSLDFMCLVLGSGEVLATIVKGLPCKYSVPGSLVLFLILVSKLGGEFNLVLQLFADQVQSDQNKWSHFIPAIVCICK